MARIIAAASMMVAAATAHAETINFDADPPATPPAGWTCGSTGGGTPVWTVEAESGAPSGANVLKQTGKAPFPWCVKQGTAVANGIVEVKFKPLAGREDQAAGVVWRWKDGDTYYVARANALENNVSLYYTERGRRVTIKYVDAPVPANTWHTLSVEFASTQIRVSLDGKTGIELNDNHVSGAGAVGVWTKADSVTAFDDFTFQARP
jgi:hypothetical protein